MSAAREAVAAVESLAATDRNGVPIRLGSIVHYATNRDGTRWNTDLWGIVTGVRTEGGPSDAFVVHVTLPDGADWWSTVAHNVVVVR